MPNTQPECAANAFDCQQEAAMKKQKLTILYARLSREDGEDGVSNSIKNQQDLLTQYAERNGFKPYLFIQDDGFSGANFQRPGWLELIARVENDEVGIICVKDGSRMARNYLQAGLYREMFREKGVRLICVNDGTDTALGDDDFTPFREIIAEWYVRDCSRKIKSAYKVKGEAGKHTSSHALYGYKKSATNKDLWEIDSPAAEIVQRIFALTIAGFGPYSIASKLTEEKVECPSYYLAQRDCGNRKNKNFVDPYRWWGTSVMYLLARVEYMGHTVNFKTTQNSYKNKQRFPNAKENWAIFENTHEAIIDPETWATANRLRDNAKRHLGRHGEPHPLTGLMFCATCGSKMYHSRLGSNAPKPLNHYTCSAYGKRTTNCTAHRIEAAVVEALVLETLRTVSDFAMSNEDDFKAKVAEMFSAKLDSDMKSQKKRLVACERRAGELDRLIKKLFEEHTLGNLNEKRFDLLSEEYEREQEELEAEIARLRSGIDSYVESAEHADNFLELVRRYHDFSELTTSMLNVFVQKIVVHERADKGCLHTTQEVDIYLSFIGQFTVPNSPHDAGDMRKKSENSRAAERREYQREYRRRREANGGKALKPADTRTPEEIAADEAAKRKKWKDYNREYQREYQRKLARQKKEAKAAASAAENTSAPLVV
jgi:DNA invertase Pin-like site-specific DNA recombinase/energy-converting hydrogenase A subunit M